MRRLLVLVCAIVLVDTAFYSVVAPLLPELEDELGLSKAEAGVLSGAYAAGTLAGALPSGLLATRVGPRRIVVTGLLLLSASSIVFGVVRDLVVLDVARFVQGVGGACSWAGAMAWLIGAAPPERRGTYIGLALGAATGGSFGGPVLGAVAAEVGQAETFGVVAAVGVLLAAAAMREPRPPAPGAAQRMVDVRRALGRPPIRVAMWLVALPAAGFGVLNTLAPLHLDDLGAAQATVAGVFLLAAVAEAGVSPLVGRISDRRGRLVPLRAGLLASAGAVWLAPLAGTVVLVTVGVLACVVALGSFWAPAMALLSDEADVAGLQQGPAFALVNLAWATGATLGAAGGGAVADLTADVLPFAAVGAACLATFAVLARGSRAPVAA